MAKHSFGDTSRIKEDSNLLVKWRDVKGEFFTGRAETHDLSDSGISFYLKIQVWVDTHLRTTIASCELFGRLASICAKVVRVRADAAERQLVGARFD